MSQPIRISTGFGPTTLQYIPKNTCIFPTKKHTTCMDVSYPTIHSREECRKRAWLSVSNRNPCPVPYATLSGNTTEDDEDDEAKGLTMLTVRILNFLMDYKNPIDGLGNGRQSLLEALQVWKMRRFEVDSNYCYLHLPFIRFHPSTSKDGVKYRSFKLTSRVLIIVVLLMDLDDPNDGFKVLNDALKVWNGILSRVYFDDEEKLPSWLIWVALIMCKIVFRKHYTPAEFRKLRSLILNE